MSVRNFGVLAFASAALAAGHHNHAHLHARGTGAAAAMPTGLPSCWGSCFQEAGVKSKDALCGNDKVTECVKTSCNSADAAQYESWLTKSCNSPAPYPTGNNSTAVGPTATGGYSDVPSGPYSTSVCTETSTLIWKTTTEYSTYLITHTLYPSSAAGGYGSGSATSDVPVGPATEGPSAPGGGYGGSAPGGGYGSPTGGAGGEECSDVTVTSTVRTYVTVTAGYGGAPSSYAAPSYPAQAPSSPASPGSQAPTPSSYVSEAGWSSQGAPAPSSYEAPSSSSAASAKSSSPPSYNGVFRGKRGIAYNESTMVTSQLMDAPKIGWASNWEGIAKGFEHSDITYIPTLHDGSDYFVSMWAEQAEAAIAAGLPYLFGPNEPDMPNQANLSPSDCADVWRKNMEPYAGRIKLVAPSVSSGIGSGIGQDWLDQFMAACSDCTINAVNQHWYNANGNDVENFKDTINGAAKYGKPIFVGEFAAIGSDQEITDFMNEVMPWMDDNNDVIAYAYFMVYQGLLVDGTGLTPYGETYCG